MRGTLAHSSRIMADNATNQREGESARIHKVDADAYLTKHKINDMLANLTAGLAFSQPGAWNQRARALMCVRGRS